MDPHAHQLSTMDPKLKAAYESVMKGPNPTAATHAEAKATTPPPGIGSETGTTTTTTTQPRMVTEVQPDQQPQIPTKQTAEPAHTVFTGGAVKSPSTGTIHIGYTAKPGHKIGLEKKKSGVPPALYIVGCILFFLLYSLFWIKVFGVKVPFLP